MAGFGTRRAAQALSSMGVRGVVHAREAERLHSSDGFVAQDGCGACCWQGKVEVQEAGCLMGATVTGGVDGGGWHG